MSTLVRPDTARRQNRYIGYRPEDFATQYGRYFRPEMAPLSDDVMQALAMGGQSPELIGGLEDLPNLLEPGYQPIETGYARGRDGSIRMAALTPMPRVTPQMWDWWFGWYAGDSLRFKLWHPRAHTYASWELDAADEWKTGRDRYIGRTSFVDEYIGSMMVEEAIRYIPPDELGLNELALDGAGHQTAICAKVGWSRHGLDMGYVVHHVRRTDEGSEMRSRFFLGGSFVEVTGGGGIVRQGASATARLLVHPPLRLAPEILVHTAQEMAHLASFLPDLYGEVSPDS